MMSPFSCSTTMGCIYTPGKGDTVRLGLFASIAILAQVELCLWSLRHPTGCVGVPMGSDAERPPSLKRAYTHWMAEDIGPGTSSSSSSSCVILPHREGPSLKQQSRKEIVAALDDDTERDVVSFIDNIAISEAIWRDSAVTIDPVYSRKRLHTKTSAEAWRVTTPQTTSVLLPTDDNESASMPSWLKTKKARSKFAADAAKTRDKTQSTYRERFNEAYGEWSTFTKKKKDELTEKWMKEASSTTPTSMQPSCSNMKPPDAEEKNGTQFSPGLLLTWNGPWFLDDAAYVDLVQEWKQLPHLLVMHISRHPGISEFFAEFRNMIMKTKQHFKLREWSCCLELSLEAVDLGRLHLHCFLERNCKEDHAWCMWKSIANTMKIRGVPAGHSVPACVKSRGKNRGRALTEGHYYCQAAKIGQVMNDSTLPKFVKLFPDARMITSLWRYRKMTTGTCSAEALASRDRAPSTLAMLESTMALEYSAEQAADAAQADTTWKSLPFKEPTAGELTWIRQFGLLASKPMMRRHRAYQYNTLEDIAAALNLRRHKFLIYDGPSRMGKTELACSWFGTLNTLVCNAQDCTTPNLRPVHSGKYSAILFDEGDWRLCYQNKTMMQASPRPVELGQSQCNDRSYQVLLFRVPLMICSNDFWHGCDNDAAREWIELNSIYIRVDTQVWMQEQHAES